MNILGVHFFVWDCAVQIKADKKGADTGKTIKSREERNNCR